jgi:hypothetical protein
MDNFHHAKVSNFFQSYFKSGMIGLAIICALTFYNMKSRSLLNFVLFTIRVVLQLYGAFYLCKIFKYIRVCVITRRELLYNYHITLYFNNNPQKGVVI